MKLVISKIPWKKGLKNCHQSVNKNSKWNIISMTSGRNKYQKNWPLPKNLISPKPSSTKMNIYPWSNKSKCWWLKEMNSEDSSEENKINFRKNKNWINQTKNNLSDSTIAKRKPTRNLNLSDSALLKNLKQWSWAITIFRHKPTKLLKKRWVTVSTMKLSQN